MSDRSDDTIRLGLMAPMTGLVSIYGREISRAGRIAADLVNETGGLLGRPLELIVADDGSLPQTAVPAAVRLVENQGCRAIIGNLLSNSRIAVADQVATPRRIPYLNFSFYEGSISSRYFFHFAALPNQQIDKMIPYMAERYGMKMYFAGNNYEWPRGSIDAAKLSLERLGGDVVGEQYLSIGVDAGEIDWVLDGVARSGADVFVPYFAGTDQMTLLRRFYERGLKNHMAVVMGHYDEVMVSHLTPEVREGLYSSNTYFMSVDTEINRFYLDRLAALPDVDGIWPHGNGALTNFGEATFNCVMAFANAVRSAGSVDPEALVRALETVRLQGPQGELLMDPDTHHAHVNSYLARCSSDGTFSIVKQFGQIPPEVPSRYKELFRIRGGMEGYASPREAARLADQIIHYREKHKDAQRILEFADMAVMVTDVQGRITAVNRSTADMFGYDEKEMIGMSVDMLIPPHLRRRHGELMQAFVNSDHSDRRMSKTGEITGYRKEGTFFPLEASVAKFRSGDGWALVGTFRDLTEIKKAQEELTRRATHDPLTGLPNRALIHERLTSALERSKRREENVALLFVDLDGFKIINDTYGHEAGDWMLRTQADRLIRSIRPGDTVARIAGDEFVILCEQVGDPTDMARLAERINDAVRDPAEYRNAQLFVTASIGVALGHGTTHSAEDMLRSADHAMYAVKQKRRDSWLFFNESLQQEAQQRIEISSGLRLALENNEMSLVFQPIVRLEDKTISGVEALLRWDSPKGPVSPGVFIPVAEMTGSIVAIGQWVFEKVCEAQRRWRDILGERAPYITFNLSARQLDDGNLVRRFTEILERTGADPLRLVLEITETSLMADIASNISFIEDLRATGMTVAVDDFGTGYSSLAQLLRLNVDTLKIDRTFVDKIEDNPINETVVAAICRMAKALKLRLVAEGVENETQRKIMLSLGCQLGQGYLFSRPVPEQELLRIIDARPDVVSQSQDRLQFVIYASRAVDGIGETDFTDILKTARNYNRHNRITGYLVFNHGVFLQYLEGPDSVINDLFDRITRDRRHGDVTMLARGDLSERLFIDWSMGFQNLDKPDLNCGLPSACRSGDLFEIYRKNPVMSCTLFEAIARYV